jgi:high-affinity nickel-transport protein
MRRDPLISSQELHSPRLPLETLNLIGDQLGLTDGGGFWGAIGDINDNFGVLGYVIIGIFALNWLGSVVFYKFMRYDDLEVTVGAPDQAS